MVNRLRIVGMCAAVSCAVLAAPSADAGGIRHGGGGGVGGGLDLTALGETSWTSNGYRVTRDHGGYVNHVYGVADAAGRHDLYLSSRRKVIRTPSARGWKRQFGVRTMSFAVNGESVASVASAISLNDHVAVIRFEALYGASLSCVVDGSGPGAATTTITQWDGETAIWRQQTQTASWESAQRVRGARLT